MSGKIKLNDDTRHDENFFDEQGIYVTVARSTVKDFPWCYAINKVTRYSFDQLSETREGAMKKGLLEAESIYQKRLLKR